MTGTVAFMRPFVVSFDVCVELPCVSMTVVLTFGPFDNPEAANEWAGEIETILADKSVAEVHATRDVLESYGLPSREFINVHVSLATVIQDPFGGRRAEGPIRPMGAQKDAREIAVYAMRAVAESITVGLLVAERAKEADKNGKPG